MQIAYYDEAGDDGFPSYSSPVFVLSSLYLHHLNWKETYERVLIFRNEIKANYGLPIKLEMHARQFLLNKNPYKKFNFSEEARVEIFSKFCEFIGSLDIRIINIAIIKTEIKNQSYQILDTSLKFSVQRIENDLNPKINPNEKFMIITDEGRVGKMRKTTRKIQKINFIPSKYSTSTYRREIRTLIEDPLPKNSKESYFIQFADVVSFIIYLHSLKFKKVSDYPNRLKGFVDEKLVIGWLDLLKPSLNLNASGKDKYGIVYHP
jgi:uncharacterized protein DUF3800